MRVKIGAIIAVWLLSWGNQAFGTTIAFYEDGVIEDGDVFSWVSVYNDATVNMSGGVVTSQLSAYDFSLVNISGGILEATISTDASTVNLSGNMQANQLGVSGSGTANMYGGTVGFIEAWNHSTVNLYGGTISDYVLAYGDESLVVNIYGYDFNYDALGGSYGGGQLTGFWLDDSPFTIDLWYSSNPGEATIDTYSHIVLVPEPATVLFLGAGMLMLRRRR